LNGLKKSPKTDKIYGVAIIYQVLTENAKIPLK
jgi:hypothetical protein